MARLAPSESLELLAEVGSVPQPPPAYGATTMTKDAESHSPVSVEERTPFVESNGTADTTTVTSMVADEIDEVSKKTSRLVYWIFVLHGIGTLMPWNMFLTIAGDYYIGYKFKPLNGSEPIPNYSKNFFSYLGIFSQLPNLILNCLNLFIVLKADLSQRIIYSLFIVAAICLTTIVFVFVETYNWMFGFFVFTMATVVILNSANGVYQNSIYGLLADFPSHFTNAVVIGNNTCGIFVTVILIITLLVSNNVIVVAASYFTVAFITVLACLATFLFVLPKLPFYNFYTTRAVRIRALTSEASKPFKWDDYQSVFKQAWVQMASVWLTFFVTLALFPAVLAGVSLYPNNREDDKFYDLPIPKVIYKQLVVFLNFNVFATVGNIIANYVQWPGVKHLVWVVLARLIFLPFFWFCNYGGADRLFPVWFTNEWLFCFGITLMSLTHGYCSSLSMMFAPRAVKESNARVAGMMSAFFLVLGIASGVAFTFVEAYIFVKQT